jgi:hypothetical protein
MSEIQGRILEVVKELPADRGLQVLDFAMFLRTQQARHKAEATA